MQPYLFPYIGYFQLIKAVEIFVIHDDVQYIKGGWINRNRILQGSTDCLVTYPVKKEKAFKNINQRFFTDPNKIESKAMLRIIKNAYQKAPFFYEVYNLLESVFSYDNQNVCEFNVNQINLICAYLNIKTKIILSSCIEKNNNLTAENRVLNINKSLNSDFYINPIGGLELYCRNRFKEENIVLSFLKPILKPYKQFNDDFVSGLSIIDVMMFNSSGSVSAMLDDYELH